MVGHCDAFALHCVCISGLTIYPADAILLLTHLGNRPLVDKRSYRS